MIIKTYNIGLPTLLLYTTLVVEERTLTEKKTKTKVHKLMKILFHVYNNNKMAKTAVFA